jgi:hypothetical protein
MTLVFGMKLASATPILLTFDWTGQCDDCQGPNGAINVPGTNMHDTYYQDVFGLLKIYYYPDIDNSIDGKQFVIKSFEYYGSSIIKGFSFAHFDVGLDYLSAVVVEQDVVIRYIDLIARPLEYKGDFEDYIPTKWGRPTYVRSYFRSFPDNWSVSCVISGGLGCDGGPIVEGPPSHGRGGGSRDEGMGSQFSMRGSLPLTQTVITTVPEPSLIAIFALGMLGLSLRHKKRT